MTDKKDKDCEYVSETVIFVGYMPRTTPFGVYNFFVIIGGKALGGFSAVPGSQIKVAPAKDRSGSDAANRAGKLETFQKVSDVTLKRGVVDSSELWKSIRTG
jgi:phage tail-like protein